jgi:hypothetical protein
MKPMQRIGLFVALLAAWLAGSQSCGMAPWSGFLRLHAMFLGGAWLALFYEGDSFGAWPPVSTRPLWIVLGCVLMAASTIWMYAIADAIRR